MGNSVTLDTINSHERRYSSKPKLTADNESEEEILYRRDPRCLKKQRQFIQNRIHDDIAQVRPASRSGSRFGNIGGGVSTVFENDPSQDFARPLAPVSGLANVGKQREISSPASERNFLNSLHGHLDVAQKESKSASMVSLPLVPHIAAVDAAPRRRPSCPDVVETQAEPEAESKYNVSKLLHSAPSKTNKNQRSPSNFLLKHASLSPSISNRQTVAPIIEQQADEMLDASDWRACQSIMSLRVSGATGLFGKKISGMYTCSQLNKSTNTKNIYYQTTNTYTGTCDTRIELRYEETGRWIIGQVIESQGTVMFAYCVKLGLANPFLASRWYVSNADGKFLVQPCLRVAIINAD